MLAIVQRAGVLGGLAGLLAPLSDVLGGLLLAAPKKRTTHRTKRLRLAAKWIKPLKNISKCPLCGSDKLLHHMCPNCLKTLKKAL
ncbi:hypothetical protein HK105_200580 [Polyrhizophydium stewartii]|uniref:Large ribosomal subunit protein bL32m n=1 Tax=Polyrhizophydium stewartii TaxID=2732419 RepID=A0ABR4NJL5_9FUNG|nr:hypothetical protein HK105_002520 [Polyrhizophydium stewartii]